jgi:hypothetical protein
MSRTLWLLRSRMCEVELRGRLVMVRYEVGPQGIEITQVAESEEGLTGPYEVNLPDLDVDDIEPDEWADMEAQVGAWCERNLPDY